MHELGLVDRVITTVEGLAQEQNILKVASVKLEIGEVSGIVPEYLKDCWDWMVRKNHPVLDGAEFVWVTDPAVTYCENCGKNYETVKYGKTCPHCGSGHTFLLKGNGMIIKEITVYE